MTSPISNDASSYGSSYDNLIRKALRLSRWARRATAREQGLADKVVETQLQIDQTRRRASIGDSGDVVPAEIEQAMRAPRGVDRLVVVYYDGMVIKAVLYPLGERVPEREAAVWRCLRDTAISLREQTT